MVKYTRCLEVYVVSISLSNARLRHEGKVTTRTAELRTFRACAPHAVAAIDSCAPRILALSNLAGTEDSREARPSLLCVGLLVKKQVCGFDIPMNDTHAVRCTHAR